MEDKSTPIKKSTLYRKLFVPSLVISNFATGALPLLTMLLLIDIGNTFNTSVGVTAQINTPYSFAAVAFALLMGAFSIRYMHKSLLLVGLLFINVSALGCFLALDFPLMMTSYALSGVGFAMVSPMAFTLVGEHIPREKRASAVGWVIAGGALVYVIGAPLIALTANFEDWRFAILAFVIPVSLAGLALAWVGLPFIRNDGNQHQVNWQTYLRSFGEVLSNRSALSCLIGDFFRSGSFVAVLIFAASFGRQRFSHSRDFISIVILVAALCYTIGSLICSKIVNRLGRKNSTVLNAFLSGALTVFYGFAPSTLLYILIVFAAALFFGMVASSANSLSLEQVPKRRGTMMSIDSAAVNLGSAIGTYVGGLMLIAFDYEGLGIVLGAMGIISALVFLLFAKDPTRN